MREALQPYVKRVEDLAEHVDVVNSHPIRLNGPLSPTVPFLPPDFSARAVIYQRDDTGLNRIPAGRICPQGTTDQMVNFSS